MNALRQEMQLFNDQLAAHDHHYQYADDHFVYKRGQASWEAILSAASRSKTHLALLNLYTASDGRPCAYALARFLNSVGEDCASSCLLSIKGKNKAEVVAALYNASKPLGLGVLQAERQNMTVEVAEQMAAGNYVFDYLKGRVMKVDLNGDEFDPRLYDRDNGQGAAAAALAQLD